MFTDTRWYNSTNTIKLGYVVATLTNHHRTSTQLKNGSASEAEEGMSPFLMCVIVLFSLPSLLSLLEVFGEAVCSPCLLEVTHAAEENLIPKKGEACRQSGLHEAGREAFEEASEALLFGYLNRAVQQASVTPHLHTRNRKQFVFVTVFSIMAKGDCSQQCYLHRGLNSIYNDGIYIRG